MRHLKDTYKHKGMRKLLVKEVASKGITDKRVLDTLMKIPRHFFFDAIFDTHAYEDKAFPIGSGQTISQPYTVAFQTELLEIKKGDKILEIGTGSGYQAAVLLEMGAEVFTIEYQKELFTKTKKFLPKLGYKPHFFQGDGSRGIPDFAPYDGIIVTAGAPSVPNDLLKQLKVGGKLIIPVGDGKTQTMMKLTLQAKNKVLKKEYNQFRFVPLLGEKGWQ
ncbi:MAG: protein-L-isoaspartate(D-aspartate) O-methyltransferase [Cyclobacteriaceae bacterium]